MLHSVEDDLKLCIEFKLNPKQLMFLKLLVRDPAYDERTWRLKSTEMALIFGKKMKGLTPDEMSDLLSRDMIVDLNTMGNMYYEYYEINPRFASKFELAVIGMPSQLFDAYPSQFKGSDGRFFLGKTASSEEIAKDYIRAINNDPEEHKRVLEDVAYGLKHNAIVLGLKKFVTTRYWEVIRLNRKKVTNNNTDVRIV